MGKPTRFGLLGLVLLLTVAAAYLLGAKVGGMWESKDRAERSSEYRSKALAHSRAVLERMGTVAEGDTLSDFSFEDIDGHLHRLSEILVDHTLLIYIKPDCDACLEEIERLSQVAHTPDEYSHFILISTANPLHLRKMREDYELQCLVLYDEERLFGNNLNIVSFPFGLMLDHERVIREVHASVLTDEEMAEVASGAVESPETR